MQQENQNRRWHIDCNESERADIYLTTNNGAGTVSDTRDNTPCKWIHVRTRDGDTVTWWRTCWSRGQEQRRGSRSLRRAWSATWDHTRSPPSNRSPADGPGPVDPGLGSLQETTQTQSGLAQLLITCCSVEQDVITWSTSGNHHEAASYAEVKQLKSKLHTPSWHVCYPHDMLSSRHVCYPHDIYVILTCTSTFITKNNSSKIINILGLYRGRPFLWTHSSIFTLRKNCKNLLTSPHQSCAMHNS